MKDLKDYLINESKNTISSESEAINMINAGFNYLCQNKSNEMNIGLESSCDMKFKNNNSFGNGFTIARIVPTSKSEDGDKWESQYNVKYILQCGNAHLAKRRRSNY